MATPLTATQLLAALNKWSVPYKTYPGWETRNRNHRGAWGPVHGFMVHHTGDDAPDDRDYKICRDGWGTLPGPLCHFGGRDDGVIDLVGWGRTNHAGTGSPAVLRAVTAQSYGDRPPPPTGFHQGGNGVDGNARFYGIETYYSGKAAPTAAMYRTLVRLAAALCDAHGWTAKAVIGHLEWSDHKVDPGKIDMVVFRRQVGALLAAGPNDTGDKDMALTADEITRIATAAATAVWGQILPKVDLGSGPVGPATAETWLRHIRANQGARDAEIVKILGEIRASGSAEALAKAIAGELPVELARQVVDALADRLAAPPTTSAS